LFIGAAGLHIYCLLVPQVYIPVPRATSSVRSNRNTLQATAARRRRVNPAGSLLPPRRPRPLSTCAARAHSHCDRHRGAVSHLASPGAATPSSLAAAHRARRQIRRRRPPRRRRGDGARGPPPAPAACALRGAGDWGPVRCRRKGGRGVQEKERGRRKRGEGWCFEGG
jgi:hypothetical protein